MTLPVCQLLDAASATLCLTRNAWHASGLSQQQWHLNDNQLECLVSVSIVVIAYAGMWPVACNRGFACKHPWMVWLP